MQILSANDPAALDSALKILYSHDGVMLAPTETVYGLLCAESSNAAKERIYQLKQRDKNKLLANFVPEIRTVLDFVPEIPETAQRFAQRFCPGPITIVIPDGDGGTFGFRIPDHPFILALLKAYGKAIASTSANLSGKKAALSVPQAMESLAGETDLAIDGGVIPEGSPASTVVLVNGDNSWKILRQGPVTEDMLKQSLAVS